MKKTKTKYGIINTPPVIIDARLRISSGASASVGFEYSGPIPKLNIEPRDWPMVLRALADNLEEAQKSGADYVEAMKNSVAAGYTAVAGAAAAKASRQRAERSK